MKSLRWVKRVPKHLGKIRALLFVISVSPLCLLIAQYYLNALGLDPLDTITRATGLTGLVFLILSLLITPLRHFLTWAAIAIRAAYGKRTSDWNWIIKLRRMIGVFSSFYILLHLIIYFWMDQAGDWQGIYLDVMERPFILIGMAGFLLLVPVTLTSTDWMMRKLGRNWRRVHRLVYAVSVFGVMHFWMLTKVGVYDPYFYMAVVFFLLGWRIWFKWEKLPHKIPDDGMETSVRKASVQK